jgi:hypothetical protein
MKQANQKLQAIDLIDVFSMIKIARSVKLIIQISA